MVTRPRHANLVYVELAGGLFLVLLSTAVPHLLGSAQRIAHRDRVPRTRAIRSPEGDGFSAGSLSFRVPVITAGA
jgi:hypothetical protein